ncbi:phenoloxidase-activating factor 1-like isoform X1 [Drosophila rhopaloa]|uniref:Serine protease easter-like isoform X1 n=1 Tax=Drosophila rhopaloa TaxID=1041015 RepID=A0A6P4E512_DRORH|nr:phenoloxidase-activating factor 1-like isoform X1 [Drosophila rhopaloa]
MFGGIPVLYLIFAVLTTLLSQIQGQSCGDLQESQLTNLKEITEPDEFPWIGRVGYGESRNSSAKFLCLAVLIKPQYAILPATCLELDDPLFILFGDWRSNRNFDEEDCLHDSDSLENCAPPPIAIDIDELVVHPGYIGLAKREYLENDIALAKLVRIVEFSNNVAPLCLPTINEDKNSHIAQKLEMVGFLHWTKISSNLRPEEEFRSKVEVNTISQEYCSSLQFRLTLNENHLCATAAREKQQFFGSPLMGVEVVNEKPHNFFLVGLPTFSIVPGSRKDTVLFVFTRVFPYIGWILRNIN